MKKYGQIYWPLRSDLSLIKICSLCGNSQTGKHMFALLAKYERKCFNKLVKIPFLD